MLIVWTTVGVLTLSLSSSTVRVSFLELFTSIKSFASLLFQGFLSLELISLPCLWCVIDSLNVNSNWGIFSWYIGLSFFFKSKNAFGNLFASFYQYITFWTSSSYCYIQGSKWCKDDTFWFISFSSWSFSPLMSKNCFIKMVAYKSNLKNISYLYFKIPDYRGRIMSNI